MIALTADDDPRFISLAMNLVEAAVANAKPAEIYLIRIDQWFDAKWLKFSGKVLGALGVRSKILTVPPFPPHRVGSEVCLWGSRQTR